MNKDAKIALEKENALVDLLATVADAFTATTPPNSLEKSALQAWAPELRGHRDGNLDLIKHCVSGNEADFNKQVNAELVLLNGFLSIIRLFNLKNANDATFETEAKSELGQLKNFVLDPSGD